MSRRPELDLAAADLMSGEIAANRHHTSREATIEALLDRRVQARLATDAAYRNAANAEEQQQREDEIETEVWDAYWRNQVGS